MISIIVTRNGARLARQFGCEPHELLAALTRVYLEQISREPVGAAEDSEKVETEPGNGGNRRAGNSDQFFLPTSWNVEAAVE
jgi:hypothetical protein